MNPESGRLHEMYKAINPEKKGPELPPHWPKLALEEKLGPFKGWIWEIVGFDLEEQVLKIKPSRKAITEDY